MKNYVQPGVNLTVPAPAAVESGLIVIAGALIGVAQSDADEGEDIVIVTEGVFDLPKVGSQAWTVGAAIYWDSAESRCTTATSGNTKIGAAVAAVTSGAGNLVGRVKINV